MDPMLDVLADAPPPVAPVQPAPTVADLLVAARAAHQRYLLAQPRMVPNGAGGVMGATGNPAEQRDALKAAAQARVQAQRIDPDGLDPAWQDEAALGTHDHDALLVEYLDALSR